MTREEADKRASEIIERMANEVDEAYNCLSVNRVGLDGPVPEEVKRIKAKGMEELKKLHAEIE